MTILLELKYNFLCNKNNILIYNKNNMLLKDMEVYDNDIIGLNTDF